MWSAAAVDAPPASIQPSNAATITGDSRGSSTSRSRYRGMGARIANGPSLPARRPGTPTIEAAKGRSVIDQDRYGVEALVSVAVGYVVVPLHSPVLLPVARMRIHAYAPPPRVTRNKNHRPLCDFFFFSTSTSS